MNKSARNAVVALAATAVVLGIGWFGYVKLTTPGPPDPSKASPDDLATFLGSPQGLVRLPVARREAFLRSMFEHLSSDESRSRLGRCIRRMSDDQKQALVDATFEVVRTRMLEAADRFDRLPVQDRDGFVSNLIADFRRLQGEPTPGATRDPSVGEAFKGLLPATGQDWNQLILARTTPEERAKATPLAMAIAQQIQEEKDLRRKKRPAASQSAPAPRQIENPSSLPAR